MKMFSSKFSPRDDGFFTGVWHREEHDDAFVFLMTADVEESPGVKISCQWKCQGATFPSYFMLLCVPKFQFCFIWK